MINTKVAMSWAQNAHMLAGATVVFATLDLYPSALKWVIGVFILLTTWKEGWYDEHFESYYVRGSGWSDWIHYQIGWIAALGIHWLL